jgi:hypothetical protein
MTGIFRKLGLLAGVLVLAGCGSSDTNLEMTNIVKGLGKRFFTKDTSAEGQKAVLQITRAQVDAFPQPLLRVRLEGTGAMSTMVEVDRKGSNSTYMTGDGVALIFRGGILTGTRGLGQDLMGLEAVDIHTAVRQGETRRNYRYLDGEERLKTVSLSCSVTRAPYGPLVILERSYQVEKITERCHSLPDTGSPDAVSFENSYWVESGTGQIRLSHQYVSPKFGHAEIEVLKTGT